MNWYAVVSYGAYFDAGTTATQHACLFSSYGLLDDAPSGPTQIIGGSVFLDMFIVM